MHLSIELQIELEIINSPVKLGLMVDGFLPKTYAFLHDGNRLFSTEFAASENEFSIVLYERKSKQKYNHSFARGIFRDLNRLATAIDLWVDKQKSAIEIKNHFAELELFEDFEIRNPNPDIDFAWMKVKNMFFNYRKYWETPEWNSRYLELLTKAKAHKAFEKLFPFTSHYWLRFSVDKDKKETWELDTYIIPTFYSQEVPETIGKFYVSYNDKPMGGQFFDSVNEALDFYADKLKEIKPIRWNA